MLGPLRVQPGREVREGVVELGARLGALGNGTSAAPTVFPANGSSGTAFFMESSRMGAVWPCSRFRTGTFIVRASALPGESALNGNLPIRSRNSAGSSSASAAVVRVSGARRTGGRGSSALAGGEGRISSGGGAAAATRASIFF